MYKVPQKKVPRTRSNQAWRQYEFSRPKLLGGEDFGEWYQKSRTQKWRKFKSVTKIADPCFTTIVAPHGTLMLHTHKKNNDVLKPM